MSAARRDRSLRSSTDVEAPAEDTKVNDSTHGHYIPTVVIGGGQAGLAVGFYLAKHNMPFTILDASERVGDAWRNRWDSLTLFTPARYDALPGMPFPAPGGSFITKDQMADYLESYAARFRLPIRSGVQVDQLTRIRDRFRIKAGGEQYEADNVIVAMSNNQKPSVPAFAPDLEPETVQLHSSQYRNPTQLQEGDVLIVGAGNSGADIAMEVAQTHTVYLAGRHPGHVPFRIEPFIARNGLLRVIRFLGTHVLTLGTPIGRRVRAKFLSHGRPLVRVKPRDLIAAGVQRVPRVSGVEDGMPKLDDGRLLNVANVIWCTGYRGGFSWIDLPQLEGGDDPRQERGVVPEIPGLHFVGLDFLYAATSDTITGVGRDARYVVEHLATQPKGDRLRRPAAARAS